MNSELISVVVPVYKGESFITELVTRVRNAIESIPENYEIILVNDASPDNSWNRILQECEKDKNVKGIKLSRNFGQHYAISAGLEHANGDWVVVMDCDLQDVPEEIPNLHDKAIQGFETVLAVRKNRRDGFLKKLFSYLFYRALSWLTGVDYDHRIANFGIYNRNVIKAIVSMGDNIRYFPSMVKWVGFRTASIEANHASRDQGKSSYNFRRLLHLSLDIILSYSDKPIRLAIKTGLVISFVSIIAAVYTFIIAIAGKIEVPGYASTIISIWFFSGLIIAIIGVVGLYVSKTFQAARRRPLFIISEVING